MTDYKTPYKEMIDYKTPYKGNVKGKDLAIEFARVNFGGKHIDSDDSVLDLGCGDGFLTDKIADICKRVVGVDKSESGIRYAENLVCKENCSFMLGSAADLPLKDDTFDVVTLFEVIEHINENSIGKFVSEVKRVLRDKGKVIITTPNPDNLLNRILGREKVVGNHKREYQPSEVKSIFGDLKMIDIVGIYLPIPPFHLFHKKMFEFIYKRLISWGEAYQSRRSS
ncbi:hypothetical protein C9439_03790 [archaeon SCG-AAA382B04]|nr:hypothetical protein C9439_03790 [archaeon SCG-AAA382B04]